MEGEEYYYCSDDDDQIMRPVSPSGQYFNSSALSISILAVLETEIPFDDSQTLTLLRDVFLPINPRFSSIMVGDKNGVKKWKRVEVKLEDHVNVPSFPAGMSPEFYDDHFKGYLSKIALNQFPQNKPLWELHIVNYPTSNAAGNIVFKLHHSLGDGFSLMGALLSCLQRADNPSLPLTFPSHQSSTKRDEKNKGTLPSLARIFSGVINTISDFGSSLIKSAFIRDGRTPIRSGVDGVEFRPITIHTLTFSLDQIKQIKEKLGVTINDVITGIVFLGTRLYMKASSSKSHDHDDDDDQQEEGGNSHSTALVMLNTRAIGVGYKTVGEMVKPNSDMPWGNHVSFLHVPIPNLTTTTTTTTTTTSDDDDPHDQSDSDPISFVMKAHKIIKRKRNSAAVYLTGRMLEMLRKFRGSEATAQYIYNTLNNSSMALSNLIGPVEQMALANHPIKGFYFVLLGGPESLSITMVSYVGKLRVAVRMEKDYIDPHKLTSCIEKAFNMVLKAAVHNTTPQSPPPPAADS